VRTRRVRKPFGIHFYIGFCRPIPSNANCRRKGQFAFSSRSTKVTEIITYCDGVKVGCERDVFHHYKVGTIAARLELRGKGEKKSY
jgi:hypothetical protein